MKVRTLGPPKSPQIANVNPQKGLRPSPSKLYVEIIPGKWSFIYTRIMEDVGKITNVSVNPTKFTLSSEALAALESIYNNWEMNVCEKYPHDPFSGGKLLYLYITDTHKQTR